MGRAERKNKEGRRPREKILASGPESLDDAELVALVLGSGTRNNNVREIARRLLRRAGGLRRLALASAGEMMSFNGIGPARAARLQAVVALAGRLSEARLAPGDRIKCSRDVFDHFHFRLRDLKKEVFLILLLDSKHRMMREIRVSEGSLTASIVHPREVFNSAIRESAGSILAVHNHPSGDPTPSCEDFEVTKRLKEAGRLIGIHLLDHVVLGDGRFVSFREHCLIDW